LARRDYYDVLGIGRDASELEIKRAFREIAKKDHPDRNPGDHAAEERFKEANEAYAILSDGDKRAAYDRFGHGAFTPGGNGAGGPGFPSSVADFVDALGDLFGGGSAQRRRQRQGGGKDLRYTLELTFVEAAFGCEKTIHFPSRRTCDACAGSGGMGPSSVRTCAACGGRGELRVQQGFFSATKTCATCTGTGKIVAEPCVRCEGSGTVRAERELAVKIPPGTDDGSVRRIAGEGEPGRRNQPAGDLQVHVRVTPHALFKRQGYDVHTEIPISFSQAALGAQIDVPTLDGKVKMRVPEGTQSGRMFRLRGKGIPQVGSLRGDQHVKVLVETPTKLTLKQRQLLEELAKEQGTEGTLGYPRKKNFLDKVRELFDV
jgi:molecular chaperone DnaJ